MNENLVYWLLFNCLLICTAQVSPNAESNSSPNGNEVQDTIDFLNQGERFIKIDNNYRDVILLIGLTGTGKSTLSRFVAGDLDDLISVDDGQFKIIYKYEGVIGNSTTVSQTIYPDLVIDETNVAFYDCPGFDDTRNTSVEIAATYFMKKVVDHAKSLKIFLVTNYDAVRQAGSRRDFVTLVEHTHSFLKNLTNYKNSIALIATKVDNDIIKVNGTYQVRPDLEMIKNIGNFLNEYRERVKGETKSKLNEYALELVDILLQSNDERKTYENIGIFRKPDEAGPLSKIDAMVEGRKKLRKLIIDRTAYAIKSQQDFGYTISKASQLKLIKLADGINERIAENVGNISREIESHFRAESKQLGNFVALTNRFQNAHSTLLAITNKVQDMTATSLIAELTDATTSLHVTISHEFLDAISNQERYLNFMQAFTSEKLPLNPSVWISELKECVNYVDEEKNWYKFLSEIYDQYSQYEFRTEITKYNVSDINDWGLEGKPQGIYITSDNFWTFVQKQKTAALIKNKRPTEFQLNVLNNLLRFTLIEKQIISCEDDNTKLVAKGDYVIFKDVNVKQCGEKLKTLHIFALHTAFIDNDLDAFGKKLNVSIIAPNWYIFGGATFNLNGTDGRDIAGTPAAGARPNAAADPGVPGKSGGNTGNFVGIGLNFVHGEKMKIIASGGKGGNGQNGGDGFQAPDPDVTNIGKGETKDPRVYLDQKLYRFYKDVSTPNNCQLTGIGGAEGKERCQFNYDVYANCGGQAGDGGKGGYGGRLGLIKIFELQTKSSIDKIVEAGTGGADGKGGAKGKNPQKVSMQYLYLYTYRRRGKSTVHTSWKELGRSYDNTCAAIKDALDGINIENIEQPEPYFSYESFVPINEYRSFVRENQNNNLKRDDLAQFVAKIDSNPDVLKSYTVKGFVDDLEQLENQFYRLQNEIDLAVHYGSLSHRIEQYVNQLNISQTPPEHLKVFNYLYTAAWSKFLTLNASEALMVIDIDNYLVATSNRIKKFEKSIRNKIIDDKRKEFRQNIESKIIEATGFIKTEIIPQISKVTKSIDGKLDQLVSETIQKQKEAAGKELELHELKLKLQNQLIFRAFFNILRLASTVGSLLGPYGQAAGAVCDGVSQIGEGFLEDGALKQVSKVPDGVKAALDGFKEYLDKNKEQRIQALQEQIDEIEKNTKNKEENENLREILDRTKILKEALENEKKSQDPDKDAIDAVEKELGELLGKKKKELEKQKGELSESQKEALEIVNKAKKVFDVVKRSVEIYQQFASDYEKIDEIQQQMEEANSTLDSMRQFEHKIYNTFWPMVIQMRKLLTDVERGLPGKSRAVLELKKWNVQTIIRDMKRTLDAVTKGFSVNEDLNLILQKLDDSFETLINVYDRIESYYDQEKLGDYMASIVSTDVSKIEVSDPVLQSALLRLDLIISANVVLDQYKLAIDAFKQAVFPFASFYLDQFRLPDNLKSDTSTDNLIAAAVKNIERLQLKIDEYDKTVINGNDRYIITTQFDGRLQSSWSLYEWSSKDYRQSIIDLFNGKEISLRASIKNGPQVNAIKFNIIELLFRVSDLGRQDELNSLLKKFKIRLIHNGNSYYRCGASFYVIDSPSQELIYSFEKVNGVPVHRSKVYQKIQNGTIMLSPYTLWTIQLENSSTDSSAFDKLSTFADRTDLVLIGNGQYVSNRAPVCGNVLSDYDQSGYTISNSLMVNYLVE